MRRTPPADGCTLLFTIIWTKTTHLWMDIGCVRLDEGSLNQLLTLDQRVQLLLSECGQSQATIWQKMHFWLNILKHCFWLKSDVLTSFWVITLTKLWHYLLTWHIFFPVHLVVILNRLFVQTLRMFILWKGCLSKLWECLFCENVVCQNSENVYSVKRLIVKTLRMFVLSILAGGQAHRELFPLHSRQSCGQRERVDMCSCKGRSLFKCKDGSHCPQGEFTQPILNLN